MRKKERNTAKDIKNAVRNLTRNELKRMYEEGKEDGLLGLPKYDAEKGWISPTLNRENHAYGEFCDKVWCDFETETTEKYAHINYFSDVIDKNVRDIYELQKQIDSIEEKADMTVRHTCEDELAESLVKMRRRAETDRSTEPMKARIIELQHSINEAYTGLVEQRSILLELNKAVHLRCEEVRNHTLQRIDVYWRGAYQTHTQQQDIPPIPEFPVSSTAEQEFAEMHKKSSDKAVEAINTYKRYYEDEEEEK